MFLLFYCFIVLVTFINKGVHAKNNFTHIARTAQNLVSSEFTYILRTTTLNATC